MSYNKKNNDNAVNQLAEALAGLMEHANQDEHIPECPFYKGDKEKSKGASSGAVSNAYRSGWDAVFGGVQIGKA